MNIKMYHENPDVLHLGCEEPRSYYIPFSDIDTALKGVREKSDRFISLNGTWNFKYCTNVYEMPDDIIDYDKIEVPSCWQCKGYDNHNYVNTRYPFPYDPPYVPHDTPCAMYEREFELNEVGDSKFYLNFEGVDSCLYVWINNEFVGYSQVSHSTSEFDITSYSKQGTNKINVLVMKWCDGSYLEDQDKFRMSGIFRDVYILKRDKKHLKDFFIHTKIDGTVTVSSDKETECSIYDKNEVIGTAKGTENEIKVSSPKLWTAETPYLYTMVIKCGSECIVQKFGIREITIENGVILLNGKKFKIKGVNRHDSDPVTGYTISREQALKDLELMKLHNINAIRTSHYPNSPWFTELCDELGFYVCDESDVEIHGVASFYGASQATTFGLLAQDKMYEKSILDRVQRNVLRDKNRTSVIMWSLGNESGYGESFEKAGRWVKEYDPSRLTHYESSVWETLGHKNDTSMLDVYSTMYATPQSIVEYYENGNTKPYVMCEFLHAMGNGPGSMYDYLDLIDKYDGFVGAFVWEWCDHAIYMGTENGKDKYYYGGDFNEVVHDFNFCMDGLVSPDRTPHTGLIEYKNALSPIRTRMENGKLVFENRLDFSDISELYKVVYEIQRNGEVIKSGELKLDKTMPHSTSEAAIPFDDFKDGEYYILVKYITKTHTALVPADYEAGFDQICLKRDEVFNVPENNSQSELNVYETGTEIIVTGSDFEYVYDKFTGIFKNLKSDGNDITEKAVEWNIMRAATDNDRNEVGKWIDAGYNRIISRAYETKTEKSADGVTIKTAVNITAVQMRSILMLDAVWFVRNDGYIKLNVNARFNDHTPYIEMPFLPRFGIRVFLPKEYKDVTYYGYGPYESYSDKHLASYIGLFNTTVEDMFEDYVKPQENGSHCGCDYMTLGNGDREFAVYGDNFTFNASEYTQEELMSKKHNFEIEKCGFTVLCLDYRQCGIGSNSCGPRLPKREQLEDKFEWTVWIKP